jgi:hypothetical protein
MPITPLGLTAAGFCRYSMPALPATSAIQAMAPELSVWFMQNATFMFFAGCVITMTLCVGFLLPETKGVPIEEVRTVLNPT